MHPIDPAPDLIEQVYDRLLGAIADGSLAGGEVLRQERLSAMLGVSRQPISHALQVLRQQGLLVAHGRRGLAVAPLDPGRIRDIYDVRAALEGLAARRSAERVRAGTADAALLGEFRRALEHGLGLEPGGAEPAIAADVAFHAVLYRLSGNSALPETVRAMWPHFKRAMGYSLSDPRRLATAWREHEGIAAAVLAGDAAEAERRAREHTINAGALAAARLVEARAA